MQIRHVRDLQIMLPRLGPGELESISAPWSGNLDGALVKSGDGLGATITDAWLHRSHLAGIDFGASTWEDVTAVGCVFERVDLSAAGLTGIRFDRCHFVGCRLSRARFAETALDNVLFEDCRLDGTTFDDVQTIGPVAFVGCVLANAVVRDCRLNRLVVDACRLREITLASSDLRGADLRGNRLAEISGIGSLRGVTIEPAQLTDLTEAVTRDLGMVVRGPMS